MFYFYCCCVISVWLLTVQLLQSGGESSSVLISVSLQVSLINNVSWCLWVADLKKNWFHRLLLRGFVLFCLLCVIDMSLKPKLLECIQVNIQLMFWQEMYNIVDQENSVWRWWKVFSFLRIDSFNLIVMAWRFLAFLSSLWLWGLGSRRFL
jgi:hypothetical protein